MMNAAQINENMLASMRRQVETTAQGKALVAAGLGATLDDLIVAMCGNLANVLAGAVEDAYYEGKDDGACCE